MVFGSNWIPNPTKKKATEGVFLLTTYFYVRQCDFSFFLVVLLLLLIVAAAVGLVLWKCGVLQDYNYKTVI